MQTTNRELVDTQESSIDGGYKSTYNEGGGMRQLPESQPGQRVVVKVPAEFEEIMPAFWNEMSENIGVMRDALKQNDFATVELMGHKTKGTALNYGVAAVGDLSRSVELAAKANSSGEVRVLLDELESYLKHIEVVYE